MKEHDMSDDDTPRFVIDGREYELPDMDTLSMGEAMTVYEYSGLGLDQLGDGVSHPGLIAAFMHIAYERGNPDAKKAKVRALIEQTSLVEALAKLQGDDAGPPDDRKTEPQRSSPRSSSGSDTSSGPDSTNGSDEPATVPSPTGATRSAT